MKNVIIAVVILLVLGLGYYFVTQDRTVPTGTPPSVMTPIPGNSQPAPGNDACSVWMQKWDCISNKGVDLGRAEGAGVPEYGVRDYLADMQYMLAQPVGAAQTVCPEILSKITPIAEKYGCN